MGYNYSQQEIQERLDRNAQYIWSAVTSGQSDSAKTILDGTQMLSERDKFSQSDIVYLRQKTLTFPCREKLEEFWSKYLNNGF